MEEYYKGDIRQNDTSHTPVMLQEVLEYMAPRDGEVYVDGTFGAGGHTRALLEAADCRVYAIDRDPTVERFVAQLKKEFGERMVYLPGRIGDMDMLLHAEGITHVNGILLDLGVSSMQLDEAERGFSFMQDGPLDMRMGESGESASELLSRIQEKELADIIYQYGGERMSRRIAKAIVTARNEEPITRTGQLVDIIQNVVRAYKDSIHPATRTFQALRIWINEELDELSDSLVAAEKLLAQGGRLVAITFHSGEDSIVKDFLRERAGQTPRASRHMPDVETQAEATFSLITKKAIQPSLQEVEANPRARSAKLRAAARTQVGQGVGS